MDNEFNYAKIEQVADDFAHHKGDYDDLMPDALKDMAEALNNADNRRDGFAVSDDIAALMAEHGAKFGKALSTAAKANREKWAPQLTEILVSAIDKNPRNAESIIKSAYALEKAYDGADSGVLLSVAERAVFRHPQDAQAVVAVVDKHMRDYEKQSDKSATTYKAFYKVYTNAFRKTHNDNPVHDRAAATANEIFEKIEFAKGNVSLEKILKRLQENPTDEATQEKFEKSLNMMMSANPKNGVEEVTKNLKNITSIEDNAAREDAYCVVTTVLDQYIKAGTPNEVAEKSGVMFTVFDAIMKAEENDGIRKSVTASAVGIMQRSLTDDKGALVIAEDKNKETFRSLKKMCDSYGDYVGLKDLIVNSAAKYRKSPEMTKELRTCMLKIFDYVLKPVEQAEGRPYALDPQQCSEFENSVFKQRRERDLGTRIYTLLNIPNKQYGVKRDLDKTFYPSKEDMRKVANLLSQYSAFSYTVALDILGKIDNEKFSNVDDAILNTLSARAKDRMEADDGKYFEEKLTEVRTQMHKHGIEQKKSDAPKQWHEDNAAKNEPKPKKRISISFSPKDLDGTMEK